MSGTNAIACWIVTSLLICTANLHAQGVPDQLRKKIDSMFAEWDTDHTPGFVTGVVRNDSLVFAKGYGMGNLEDGVPITRDTRFYVASLSKQFTGFSIVLLARQNKLKLDEDIRVYLPWFPDMKKKITVTNLLNHTSGIRDDLNLIAISGLGIDGVLTNDLVIKTLKGQQRLNFDPGERYSYSNSNYILLAEIVKAVSGKSLRQFADSAIFVPLKMTRTHFHDNPSELIKGRADSYYADGNGGYVNAFQNVYTVGDGGVFTTVEDFAKWMMHLCSPHVGDKRDIETMTTRNRLNRGKQLSYAAGISVGEEAGWKRYSHGGALHGYRSFMAVYPEARTGIVVMGNVSGDVYGMVGALARTFIHPRTQQKKDAGAVGTKRSLSGDSTMLKTYSGEYISDNGYLLKISWQDGTLSGSGFGQNFEVVGKEKSNTFLFPSRNNPLTKIVFNPGAANPEFELEFPDEVLRFTRLDDTIVISPSDLVGEYYCEELDCTYRIVLKNGELFLSHPKYPDSRLTLRETHLKRYGWFMNHMRIIRDQEKIKGFEVNSGNVMHLQFAKVK